MVEMPLDDASVEGAAETKSPYHKPTFKAFGTVRELTHATPSSGDFDDYIVSDYSTIGYG
jgi:hypothetical protein